AQLFPNPVSEQLLLQLDAPYQQAEMQIADVQGKIIYTAQWKGQQQIQVSVADWPAGLYLLRFTTEKGDFISRFQKL
ncbi:MAG TPA: T9SS type A sorting domain-containing protein, partial [Chitinophagales bacterium]|nr:T9SS type A sorting domain-containing protein [Chitinophagales bacterium]